MARLTDERVKEYWEWRGSLDPGYLNRQRTEVEIVAGSAR